MTIISHGMASMQTAVSAMVMAARVAMASDASWSAAALPSDFRVRA